jgi:hypothetical protein
MHWDITDAYAHIGLPRFGSIDQLLHYMDIHQLDKSVAVLGPLVPDIATLAEAASTYSDRLRLIGIPFGETKEERLETVQLQLDAGALGIRFEYREAIENPELLMAVGVRGRWAYGIDACRDQQIAAIYLNWLMQYPEAGLAAPHFMYPNFQASDRERAGGAIAELMGHPRFYGILVRNLGMCGSPYPHSEYKEWIDYVMEQCGPQHLMWGSEYPVLLWRNEGTNAAVNLFREFLGDFSEEQFAQVIGANAIDLFFSGSPPEAKPISLPEWIEHKFQRNRHVKFFPSGLDLSTEEYSRLLDDYLRSAEFEQGKSMSDFLLRSWRVKQ